MIKAHNILVLPSYFFLDPVAILLYSLYLLRV